MSTYGIIFIGYNTESYISDSLAPWIEARRSSLGGHSYIICAVSLPFAGFPHDNIDNTIPILQNMLDIDQIDHIITEPRNIPETTARGMALSWLKSQDVDIVIQWDSDEILDQQELTQIISTVESNPWIIWFRLSYRNLVFTSDQWLAEPFTPPRIHRIKVNFGEAVGFEADNDIIYQRLDGVFLHQRDLSSITIPWSIASPLHYTWLNDDRSRRKIEYQLKGRGWPQCSFSWDDSKGGLIFNPALPAPKVIRS